MVEINRLMGFKGKKLSKHACQILLVKPQDMTGKVKAIQLNQIRRAYNALAPAVHPDKNKSQDSVEAIQILNNAKAILVQRAENGLSIEDWSMDLDHDGGDDEGEDSSINEDDYGEDEDSEEEEDDSIKDGSEKDAEGAFHLFLSLFLLYTSILIFIY